MSNENAKSPGASALTSLSQEEQVALANALSRVEAELFTAAFNRLKVALWIAAGAVAVVAAASIGTIRSAVIDAAANRLSGEVKVRDGVIEKVSDYVSQQLPNATEQAVARINQAANERAAGVVSSYRLNTRVRLKAGQPSARIDFSQPEYDPRGAVRTGTENWTFTAPSEGQYLVTVALMLGRDPMANPDLSVPNASAFLILFKNDKEASYFGHYTGDSRQGLHPAGVATIHLEKGDRVYVGVKFTNVPRHEEWGTEPNGEYNFLAIVKLSA